MNKKIRNCFPWLIKHPNLLYFDNAATSLKPQCVLSASEDFYINYGTNTHNNDSILAYKTTQKIFQARQKIATLFNANPNNIIFTSGATESLNSIAWGLKKVLKKNDEIVISQLEHASNLLPWIHLAKTKKAKLKFLPKNNIPTINDYLNAITNKSKIVTFSASSNILGNIFDYSTLTKKIKNINKNIIVVIDAAQYLPHHKMNIKCQADFIVCSAHKILGPTGLGCTYMSDYWIKNLEPWKYGGGMNEKINLKSYTLNNGYEKFEGGTLPLAQIFAWAEGVNFLNKIGWNKLIKYQLSLKKYFIKKLKNIKNIIIYNSDTPLPIIFFNIKNVHAQDLASWLGTKGVICRSGLSCAKLAHYVIKTQAAVRLSLYFYNTKKEIDKFLKIIINFKKGDEIILEN